MESNRTRWAWIVGSILILVWTAFPIFWIISLSFKQPGEIGTNPSFLPKQWTGVNYQTVFKTDLFTAALINSIGISLIATLIGVVFATLVAYAIARLEFPGKRWILNFALAIAMFSVVSLVVQLINLWRSVGLYDTWPGLIIPYISFALPLAAPGVFTAAILTFFFCWNDFVFGISLTSTSRARPVPAALAFFTGESQFEQPTTAIAAASVVVTIPVVAIVLLFQRRIVAGLTSGAVKG